MSAFQAFWKRGREDNSNPAPRASPRALRITRRWWRRRTELTVETVWTVVRRSPEDWLTEWCPICELRVPMGTPEEAAASAGVSLRTIYGWVGAGTVHFTETSTDAAILICLNSLPRGS